MRALGSRYLGMYLGKVLLHLFTVVFLSKLTGLVAGDPELSCYVGTGAHATLRSVSPEHVCVKYCFKCRSYDLQCSEDDISRAAVLSGHGSMPETSARGMEQIAGGPKHGIYTDVNVCKTSGCNSPVRGSCGNDNSTAQVSPGGMGGRRHGRGASLTLTRKVDMDAVVSQTWDALRSKGIQGPLNGTLAVMQLHTRNDAHWDQMLNCSIKQLSTMMTGTTKLVYVFVNDNRVIDFGPSVVIVPLPERAWKAMPFLRMPIHNEEYAHDYRQMGTWRLDFQFEFARRMGHRVLLQTDADLFVQRPIDGDLVHEMISGGQLMGGHCMNCYNECPCVSRGLPELARFFIATRDFVPEGPLLSHCSPHSVEGLTLDGWDKSQLAGHFNFFDIDFWFRADVHDFVSLALRTGANYEERWNELGTESMVRHLFVPDDLFRIVGPGQYVGDGTVVHTKDMPSFCNNI